MSDARAIAAAVFVKTPGRSPVKTRLAATLGQAAAERLHRAGADAVAAVLQAAGPTLQPLFAVAEPDGFGEWPRLPCIAQGEGGLGERLHRVQASLLRDHHGVLLLGADSPQLEVVQLHAARDWLHSPGPRIVFGAAADGGFWILGANMAIEAEVWTGIDYSRPGTGAALLEAAGARAAVLHLPTLCDLDTAADIAPVLSALQALPAPLPEQVTVRTLLHEAATPRADAARPAARAR